MHTTSTLLQCWDSRQKPCVDTNLSLVVNIILCKSHAGVELTETVVLRVGFELTVVLRLGLELAVVLRLDMVYKTKLPLLKLNVELCQNKYLYVNMQEVCVILRCCYNY